MIFNWKNPFQITVKTVHACPPSSFEVSGPIFKCRMGRSGNSSQIFTPNGCNIPTECSSKSCKFHSRSLLARELFKQRFKDGRGGPWRWSRFEFECSWIEILLKVWDVRREAKRFVSASDLNELKEKGKTRYTFSGLAYLAQLCLEFLRLLKQTKACIQILKKKFF